MRRLAKFILICFCGALAYAGFSACGPIDVSRMHIMVVSREDGSGARTAFDSMVRNADGDRLSDLKPPGTHLLQGTGGVLGAVEINPSAIGYVSLGSVAPTVRAIRINGYGPREEGFPLARDFNIGYAAGVTLNYSTQNFVSFLQSIEAQDIIAARELGRLDNVSIGGERSGEPRPNYAPMTQNHTGGSILIRGSTSVEPVMNHLIIRFLELNPNRISMANFDISAMGTSHGTAAITDSSVNPSSNWVRTISMRSSPESRPADQVTQFDLCEDIIAVIVHPYNTVENLSLAQLYSIFARETRVWSAVLG